MGKKRMKIFNWSRLTDITKVPYHFFTQRKLTDADKEKLLPVIEKGVCEMLEGNYKLIKASDADKNSDMKDINLTLEDIYVYRHILPELGLYAVWSTKEVRGIKGVNAIICTFSEHNGLEAFEDSENYEKYKWLDELPKKDIKIAFLEEL